MNKNKKFISSKVLNNFKLNKFLINSLINHTLYLGYMSLQLDTRMSYYLLGVRKNLTVHNLNSTYYLIRKVINICNFTWFNFGSLWVITPKNLMLKSFLFKNKINLSLLRKRLFFWIKPWIPGFLNNLNYKLLFKKGLFYPNTVFYLKYTNNEERINETQTRGILSYYIIDTNNFTNINNTFIHSNEITAKSNFYYSKLLLSTSIFHKKLRKKNFII